MNICNDRHTPIYKITYKGFRGSRHNPEWLVCKTCMKNKLCFGNNDEILKIEEVKETTTINF